MPGFSWCGRPLRSRNHPSMGDTHTTSRDQENYWTTSLILLRSRLQYHRIITAVDVPLNFALSSQNALTEFPVTKLSRVNTSNEEENTRISRDGQLRPPAISLIPLYPVSPFKEPHNAHISLVTRISEGAQVRVITTDVFSAPGSHLGNGSISRTGLLNSHRLDRSGMAIV